MARIQLEQFVEQSDGVIGFLLGQINASEKNHGLLIRRGSLQLQSEVGAGFIQTAEFQVRLAQLEMRQRQLRIELNRPFVFLDSFVDMDELVRPAGIGVAQKQVNGGGI